MLSVLGSYLSPVLKTLVPSPPQTIKTNLSGHNWQGFEVSLVAEPPWHWLPADISICNNLHRVNYLWCGAQARSSLSHRLRDDKGIVPPGLQRVLAIPWAAWCFGPCDPSQLAIGPW